MLLSLKCNLKKTALSHDLKKDRSSFHTKPHLYFSSSQKASLQRPNNAVFTNLQVATGVFLAHKPAVGTRERPIIVPAVELLERQRDSLVGESQRDQFGLVVVKGPFLFGPFIQSPFQSTLGYTSTFSSLAPRRHTYTSSCLAELFHFNSSPRFCTFTGPCLSRSTRSRQNVFLPMMLTGLFYRHDFAKFSDIGRPRYLLQGPR